MNKKLIWGIIIVIVLIGGILIEESVRGNLEQLDWKKTDNNPVATSTTWKTYEDQELKLGFEIQYPTDWKITIDRGAYETFGRPSVYFYSPTTSQSVEVGISPNCKPLKPINYKTRITIQCVTNSKGQFMRIMSISSESGEVLNKKIIDTFKLTN